MHENMSCLLIVYMYLYVCMFIDVYLIEPNNQVYYKNVFHTETFNTIGSHMDNNRFINVLLLLSSIDLLLS